MPFLEWLEIQLVRTDPIGAFARYALKQDKIFPREKCHRLHILLLRYEHMPVQRTGAKLAHAEWRRARRQERELVA